jgi:leucyl-tRNA---protein transferase
MSKLNDLPLASLQFYATAPYPCSYIPGRLARSQVATPSYLIDAATYGALVQAGFRRSGAFTYRPHCDFCKACTPVRVVVDEFSPNRSQRRCEKQHRGLSVSEQPLKFQSDHYALYRKYQNERHKGGGMDHDSREQYSHFLLQSHIHTRLIEFREATTQQLRMVSIIDVLPDGLSSVYTFYDPSIEGGFGTYNILWQIAEAKRLQLPYLYLGYWIASSRKMNYKTNFQPIEALNRRQWQRM